MKVVYSNSKFFLTAGEAVALIRAQRFFRHLGGWDARRALMPSIDGQYDEPNRSWHYEPAGVLTTAARIYKTQCMVCDVKMSHYDDGDRRYISQPFEIYVDIGDGRRKLLTPDLNQLCTKHQFTLKRFMEAYRELSYQDAATAWLAEMLRRQAAAAKTEENRKLRVDA